jgi:hypothetical protein
MKKYLFIVFAIALGTTATAQKKLYIYNFSSYDVTVSDIMTKHVTNYYPTLLYNNPYIVIPAEVGSFELSNNLSNTPLYRFPFYSTADLATTPTYSPTWGRCFSSTNCGTLSSVGAMTLQSPASNAQVFHCIKYEDGAEAGLLGTGPLGESELVLTNTIGYYEEFVTGTLTEYVIVILNNE